jgi:F420-non-reducing hydrogenase iron-sulfur subunit
LMFANHFSIELVKLNCGRLLLEPARIQGSRIAIKSRTLVFLSTGTPKELDSCYHPRAYLKVAARRIGMEQDLAMETNSTTIVVYHCRNLKLFRDRDQKAFSRSRPGVTLVMIPCSGKIEAHHLLKTLAGGADGVLVLACAESACQYLEGSMRSNKRVNFARSWLRKINMEPERLEFIHQPPMDVEALDNTLRDFRARLESLGSVTPIASASAG